jgi:hypothetical protein
MLAGRKPRSPSVPELLCAAESIVMTSVQEGFGFPYLEGAGLGCRLVARKLPAIQPDLETFGIRLPGLYDEILIPSGLFDAKAEFRRQEFLFRQWKKRLPASCRALAGTPWFLSHPERPVPFSRLTLDAQLEVLAVPPHESWKACAGPVLEQLSKGSRVEWEAPSFLSPGSCAERFLENTAVFPKTRVSPAQAEKTQQLIIAERLGPPFLYPLLMQA